ncbi:UDP-3-O-(3-hydroxymyristoyl)glucosamine N-acyltransferase [Nitrospina watsonii]|uniref:UDP-3-O-acylglucosamine N-acyltransferase n=1 Tax=Nitrospina watsonii TaxID=1323948 RepID=A0ABM9HCB8_9BACT|nr:UDP-3-O-(3-hydroxymyristoyl)glucosamine N-acyltransferase [Nitrospina watsonii]CAI2717804.1 UDP-3-O-acylglucosamine N-acyltransferase [Nitrospina watsonii]
MKLADIIQQVGGTVEGDDQIEITDASGLEHAAAGHITFIADNKYKDKLAACAASAVLVKAPMETDKVQVIHPAPQLAFAHILAAFHPEPRPAAGIDARAAVDETAKLGQNVTVSPFVSIGRDVSIGDNTVLYPGVVVHDGCRIGNDCILHANVVLYRGGIVGNGVILHSGVVVGADGFGYTPNEKGEHVKIMQVGRVVIEDNVEVGANTCIDRAAFGETVIRTGTKIDNQVQIAHNCDIGPHSILVSQVGLSGSCTLGHHVILAGQVGLADHVSLGNQVIIAAKAGVNKSIPDAGFYGGSPAVSGMTWKKYVTTLPKLPEMAQKLRELEKRLNAIENK